MFRAKTMNWIGPALFLAAIVHAQDATPPAAYKIGGDVSQPQLLHKIEPEYTEEARGAHIEGTVQLQIVVDEHGNPMDLRVTRSVEPGLDQKAIEAVKQWTFKPGLKDGVPVRVIATVQVNFRLLPNPPVSASPPVPALPSDPEKLAAVEELVSLMNYEAMVQQAVTISRPIVEAAIGHAIDQNLPKDVPSESIAAEIKILQRELTDKIMANTRARFKPTLMSIYGDLFTTQQIHEIAAFYRTPTGQALIVKMPEVGARANALGAQGMQQIAPELQMAISDWLVELRKRHDVK